MVLLLLLFITGLLAGLVDAMAGGGGLITLPVLMAAGLPAQQCLGTNKFQAAFGTASAVWRYACAGLVTWSQVRWAVLWTFIGATLGAYAVSRLSADGLENVVPWLLLVVAVYTLCSPDLGMMQRVAVMTVGTFSLCMGLGLGFYDGFFGPGTGAFWTLACVGLLGLSLPQATAYTKVVNLTSNVASILIFAQQGSICWELGAVMILGQLIGAQLGAGLVLKHGAWLVRRVFLTVVLALVAFLLLR